MPCRDYSDYEYGQIIQRKLNDVTRLLCKMLAHYGTIPGDEELRLWKEEHDELDRRHAEAQREMDARRQANVRRAELLKSARAKLAAARADDSIALTREELQALEESTR